MLDVGQPTGKNMDHVKIAVLSSKRILPPIQHVPTAFQRSLASSLFGKNVLDAGVSLTLLRPTWFNAEDAGRAIH